MNAETRRRRKRPENPPESRQIVLEYLKQDGITFNADHLRNMTSVLRKEHVLAAFRGSRTEAQVRSSLRAIEEMINRQTVVEPARREYVHPASDIDKEAAEIVADFLRESGFEVRLKFPAAGRAAIVVKW